MSCDCHREDSVEIQHHVLVLLLAINATMFCLEIAAGILANSTALLADSQDMLADAAIYGIALYAVGKPDSAKRTAALISGIFQGMLGLLVIGEVIRHFLCGSEPTSLVMIMVVSSLPDQKSSSKPVRIPPPWYRSKSIAGHGCGRHDDRFQRFVQGPELLQ